MEKEEENMALRAEIAMLTRLINDPTAATTTGGLPGRQYNYRPPVPAYHHSSVQHSFPSSYKYSSQYYRNAYASGYRQSPYHASKSKYTYNAAAKKGLKTVNSTATSTMVSAKPAAPFVGPLSSLVRNDLLLPRSSVGALSLPKNDFVQASSLVAPVILAESRLNSTPNKFNTLSNGWVTKSRYKVDRRVKSKKPETPVVDRRGYTPPPPSAKYSTFFHKKSVSPKASHLKSPLRKRVEGTSQPNNVVNIRGTKYVSDNLGKTLKRIRSSSVSTSASPSPTKRVANRVLQRSVKMGRKRNDTCLFFDRFRYCKRQVLGTCPFVHKIDTARRRRKSSLSIAELLTLSKPCKFYNLGRCSRDDCPYLHVKSKARSERRRRARLSRLTPSSSQEKRDGHKDPTLKPKKPVARYYHVSGDPESSSKAAADQAKEDSERESDFESCDSDSDSATSEESYESESEYEEVEYESDDSVQEIPVSSSSPKSNKCELLMGGEVSEICALKVEVNEEVETVSGVGSGSPPSAHELRRQRLMSKVANLKRRYARPTSPTTATATNPTPISTAPTFLSF